MPLPPRSEIERVLSIVDVSFERLTAVTERMQAVSLELDTVDQSILSKAFRGELVPQDPNDEPASALLERIRQERTRLMGEQSVGGRRQGVKMKCPVE